MYSSLSPKSPFTVAGLLFLVGITIVFLIKEKRNRHIYSQGRDLNPRILSSHDCARDEDHPIDARAHPT
jgi:hypothetical protein